MFDQSMSAPVIYKDIPGFRGYRVGNDGSVWSLRTTHGHVSTTWRQLKPLSGRKGHYHRVFLRLNGRNGRRITWNIHRLVLEVFIGPCPAGMVCCHNDGNRTNNCLSNLRWDTPRNNSLDRRRHGTMLRGSRVGTARINEMVVEAVLDLLKAGWSDNRLGILFDVETSTIWRIRHGQSWIHVSPPINSNEAAVDVILGNVSV